MTDGKSQDSVVRPSRDLRNAGVSILALGIGRRARQSELNQMAMNRRHVFIADFRNLHRVVSSIKRTACGGTFHYMLLEWFSPNWWSLALKKPFPSYLEAHCESEVWCTVFYHEIFFIQLQTKLIYRWKALHLASLSLWGSKQLADPLLVFPLNWTGLVNI